SIAIADHDIHVSVTDIDLRDDATVEVVIKTYLDDLQTAVGLTPGTELPREYTSADQMISKYVNRSMELTLNDKEIDLVILSIDANPEAVWITMTAPIDINTEITTVHFRSTFLTDVFDDQANIVKVITDNGRKNKALNGMVQEAHIKL
ncbi:MAG: DUF6702 family protein, partial [Bacteroidota bacterium]